MPTTAVHGIRLYWELTGSAGMPLVLVHGSWDDHHFWDLVISELAQSFQVVAYDRRGHSQSERPAGQGSVREDVVARIAAALPHAEHRTFPEAGHAPPVSHPHEYVETIKEFIAKAT